jgi:hypothetical protein
MAKLQTVDDLDTITDMTEEEQALGWAIRTNKLSDGTWTTLYAQNLLESNRGDFLCHLETDVQTLRKLATTIRRHALKIETPQDRIGIVQTNHPALTDVETALVDNDGVRFYTEKA